MTDIVLAMASRRMQRCQPIAIPHTHRQAPARTIRLHGHTASTLAQWVALAAHVRVVGVAACQVQPILHQLNVAVFNRFKEQLNIAC